MRTLPTTLALLALAAAAPAATAAPAGRGLAWQRSIYVDAADAPLRAPEGVACDDKGTVVVADTGNARLVLYRWKDGVLDAGKALRLAQLPYPVRVQIDSKGFVLALDRRARAIVRVDAGGAFAGLLEAKGAPGPVVPAAFRLDADDDAFILDVIARKVLVLAPDGKVTRQLPLPKDVRGATDVAVDGAGTVYVVDAVGSAIFSAAPAATELSLLWRAPKDLAAFPTYLAPDGHGKLLVTDEHGGALDVLGSDGGFQARDLGMGRADGELYYPGQLCVTPAGEVLVADRDNDRVQIFGPARHP